MEVTCSSGESWGGCLPPSLHNAKGRGPPPCRTIIYNSTPCLKGQHTAVKTWAVLASVQMSGHVPACTAETSNWTTSKSYQRRVHCTQEELVHIHVPQLLMVLHSWLHSGGKHEEGFRGLVTNPLTPRKTFQEIQRPIPSPGQQTQRTCCGGKGLCVHSLVYTLPHEMARHRPRSQH